MNKAELRSHLKQLRQSLTDNERRVLSQKLCDRLETIDWSEVRTLHCFEPMTKLGEVNVADFVSSLQTQYPEIQLYTSRLIDNVWNIVSWRGNDVAEPLQFDAVIVPMLGFDSSLHRIGYGGGYYDKFLASQRQARKIGVCFGLGKLQHIPTEPHDVPLDIIITESQVYGSQGRMI